LTLSILRSPSPSHKNGEASLFVAFTAYYIYASSHHSLSLSLSLSLPPPPPPTPSNLPPASLSFLPELLRPIFELFEFLRPHCGTPTAIQNRYEIFLFITCISFRK
jgi:hypothetical protein